MPSEVAKCRFARMAKCRWRSTADYNTNIKNTAYISQIYSVNALNKIIKTLHNIYSRYLPYLFPKYNENRNTIGYHGNSRYCYVPNNSGGVIRVGEGKNAVIQGF